MIWGWFLIISLIIGYLLLILFIIFLATGSYVTRSISTINQSRDYYTLPPQWIKYPLWSIYKDLKATFVDRTGLFDLTIQYQNNTYYLTYSSEYDSMVFLLKPPIAQLPGSLEWYMKATDKSMIGQLYYITEEGRKKELVVENKGYLRTRPVDFDSVIQSQTKTIEPKINPVYLIKLGEYIYITDTNFVPISLMEFPLVNSDGRLLDWPQIWNPLIYQPQYKANIGLTMILKEQASSVSLLNPTFGSLDPITYKITIPWFYNYNPWRLTPIFIPNGIYYFVSDRKDTLILSQRPSVTTELTVDAMALIDINTCLNNYTMLNTWLNSALVVVDGKISIGSYNPTSLQPRPLGTSSEGMVTIASSDQINKGRALQFQLFIDEQGFIVLADTQRNPILLADKPKFDQIDKSLPSVLPMGWYKNEDRTPIRGRLYQLKQRTDQLFGKSMDSVLQEVRI